MTIDRLNREELDTLAAEWSAVCGNEGQVRRYFYGTSLIRSRV